MLVENVKAQLLRPPVAVRVRRGSVRKRALGFSWCPRCGSKFFVHVFTFLRISQKVLRTSNSFSVPHSRNCRRACSRAFGLPGNAPRSTLRAEPAEDKFAFAKNALTESARSRLGHVVPLHVLYIATAVADEVVMPDTFRIKARGAAFDGHFTHQASLH